MAYYRLIPLSVFGLLSVPAFAVINGGYNGYCPTLLTPVLTSPRQAQYPIYYPSNDKVQMKIEQRPAPKAQPQKANGDPPPFHPGYGAKDAAKNGGIIYKGVAPAHPPQKSQGDSFTPPRRPGAGAPPLHPGYGAADAARNNGVIARGVSTPQTAAATSTLTHPSFEILFGKAKLILSNAFMPDDAKARHLTQLFGAYTMSGGDEPPSRPLPAVGAGRPGSIPGSVQAYHTSREQLLENELGKSLRQIEDVRNLLTFRPAGVSDGQVLAQIRATVMPPLPSAPEMYAAMVGAPHSLLFTGKDSLPGLFAWSNQTLKNPNMTDKEKIDRIKLRFGLYTDSGPYTNPSTPILPAAAPRPTQPSLTLNAQQVLHMYRTQREQELERDLEQATLQILRIQDIVKSQPMDLPSFIATYQALSDPKFRLGPAQSPTGH